MAKLEEVTYVRNSLDHYCSSICDMGDWLNSAYRREVDTSIVGFSFGVVGVEFDYWEWVMGSENEKNTYQKSESRFLIRIFYIGMQSISVAISPTKKHL